MEDEEEFMTWKDYESSAKSKDASARTVVRTPMQMHDEEAKDPLRLISVARSRAQKRRTLTSANSGAMAMSPDGEGSFLCIDREDFDAEKFLGTVHTRTNYALLRSGLDNLRQGVGSALPSFSREAPED